MGSEMCIRDSLYEQDVNRTFLLGASRKGEELDVSGNNDSANNK